MNDRTLSPDRAWATLFKYPGPGGRVFAPVPRESGVESAVAQAKAAARGKVVQVVGGASVAQQLFDLGLVNELHVDVMPVFLGTGRRFFDSPSLKRVKLEKIDVREVGARTSLRFRVRH